MTNKNILEVCLSPDLGGLELYMKNCSKELQKEFNVFTVIAKKSKLEQYFENSPNTFCLNRKSSFSLVNAYKLARIIDYEQIDIIHLHWTKDIPIAVFGKLFSKRKPKLVQTRHMTMTRFKSDFYHKFLYKNIDLMIAVTKAVENQLCKYIPSDIRPEITQIYLGAQCPDEYSQDEIEEYRERLKCTNEFMIGFVGRINEFKGQYLLIEAMKNFKDKELNIKAFFVGHAMNERYLNQLKQKVKEYALEDFIMFLGFTNEPHKFMQSCDCIVMASKNETFGLVAIESMQMGTLVIAPNAGGPIEIIDNDKTGLLFISEDIISLSEQIKRIYDDRITKEKIALQGKKKSQDLFSIAAHFQALTDTFKKN